MSAYIICIIAILAIFLAYYRLFLFKKKKLADYKLALFKAEFAYLAKSGWTFYIGLPDEQTYAAPGDIEHRMGHDAAVLYQKALDKNESSSHR